MYNCNMKLQVIDNRWNPIYGKWIWYSIQCSASYKILSAKHDIWIHIHFVLGLGKMACPYFEARFSEFVFSSLNTWLLVKLRCMKMVARMFAVLKRKDRNSLGSKSLLNNMIIKENKTCHFLASVNISSLRGSQRVERAVANMFFSPSSLESIRTW